ncbi:MAG: DUF2970 domain-containing protein [Pseudomonadales bacterium]
MADTGQDQPDSNSNDIDEAESTERNQPGFWAITFSVIAAAFGVQSDKNRQRDFSQGSPLPYILGGLIFTALFVLTLVGIVMLVVS